MNVYNLDYELSFSRFILKTDCKINELLYTISPIEWSRGYEYKWAISFVDKDDVCLDIGCGLLESLKFYLTTVCKEVYGCDIEESIEDKIFIGDIIKRNFGDELYYRVKDLIDNVILTRGDSSDLPYTDKKFNKIYCISLLSSLEENLIEKSLLEFNRVLKDDGLLIITFEHPKFTVDDFVLIIDAAGFKFAGNFNLDIHKNAIKRNLNSEITCFRAILIKNNEVFIESAEIIEKC